MDNWAPIVYGRTKYVDFRLLTKPEDFLQDDIAWAKKFIQSTTFNPQDLYNQSLWSLFKDKKHCVFGITCRASLLSKDFIEDSSGRSLYTFVGFASKSLSPRIPDLSLDIFRTVYTEAASVRWEEKDYQVRKNDLKHKTIYNHQFENNNEFTSSGVNYAIIAELNKNTQKLRVYPHQGGSPDQYKTLDTKTFLLAASQVEGPVSICLGLMNLRDALRGCFLNVSICDVYQKRLISREVEQPSSDQLEKSGQVKSVGKASDKEISKQKIHPKQQNSELSSHSSLSYNTSKRNNIKNPVLALLDSINEVKESVESFLFGDNDISSHSTDQRVSRPQSQSNIPRNTQAKSYSKEELEAKKKSSMMERGGFKKKIKKSEALNPEYGDTNVARVTDATDVQVTDTTDVQSSLENNTLEENPISEI
jgi:hypothetical protein